MFVYNIYIFVGTEIFIIDGIYFIYCTVVLIKFNTRSK